MPPNASPAPLPVRFPSQVAYQDAIACPAVCFADPLLRICEPVDKTPWGSPAPITGQFANVYRLRSPDGRVWAVKLFLRDVPDRTRCYHALQTHLQITPVPPWLVPFAYHERGIRIEAGWFPVLQMPWLHDGLPLNSYLGAIVNNPVAVRALRGAWRTLIADMERARFAHGDLQHGNVLVSGGAGGTLPVLHLLDYDGAWVPALVGRVASESGHPAYQHPGRKPGDFGIGTDRFAAVAVDTALLILTHAPDLWYRFDNGENILWRREDFAQTRATGRALHELSFHESAPVRRAASALRAVCEAPATQVPDLERYAPLMAV